MRVFTAKDKLPVKNEDETFCFLAGSIDFKESTSWRDTIIKGSSKNTIFFDPTREDHDTLDNQEMVCHIHWELEALELADMIILNFLPEAKSPISLVEFGLYMKSNKLIVVCPKEFYQYRYVSTICDRYNTSIYHNLQEVFKYV
ncbi:nucleoside 2-deoxyribosyltransferase domain-containing protein [Tenacibaculum sp. 190524A05c]|uniref:nucleoside 2-deoxyribosyltransferase domain-containing protein n=1 Tax=Tenacibaculum platacis TaxID=3137852 RepID=UPI0032B24219